MMNLNKTRKEKNQISRVVGVRTRASHPKIETQMQLNE